MFTARPYQIELVEHSLSCNIIACLNSVSDKHFIFLSHLREVITRDKQKLNIVLVLLSDGSLSSFSEALNRQLRIAVETIENDDLEQWKGNSYPQRVIVTTPCIFLKAIKEKSNLASLISVLIADDCHLVVKDDSELTKIMKFLDENDSRPQILAATNALLKDDQTPESLKHDIETMENVLHGRAETATDLIGGDQLQMSMVTEQIIICGNNQQNVGDLICEIQTKIKEIITPAISWLEQCQITSKTKFSLLSAQEEASSEEESTDESYYTVEEVKKISCNILKTSLAIMEVLGSWCFYKYISFILRHVYKALQLIKKKDSCQMACLLLQHLYSQLRVVYTLCHRQEIFQEKNISTQLLSSKVVRLLQVLREFKPQEDEKKSDSSLWWEVSDTEDDDDITIKQSNTFYTQTSLLCGILFVDDQTIGMMLHHLLDAVHEQDKDLQHVFSAHSTKINDFDPFEKNSVKQNEEEVLRDFRSREINLLISSSGLEEAADLPKCNLVVRFDLPKTFRSYIQSKCRNRGSASSHIVMVNEDEKVIFMSKLQEFKRIEQILQRSSSIELPDPIDDGYFDEIDSELYPDQSLIPPYFSGPHSCVTMKSAIHVINRYCARLPNDTFTHLTTQCTVTEEESIRDDKPAQSYRCTLQLPINSLIRKPIHGPLMPAVQLAQKAVAMEVCKLLHKSGELDDHFMPISKETIKYEEELEQRSPEKFRTTGRPGTIKRRQTYEKEIPGILKRCLPRVGVSLFLYECRMNLTSKLPDDLNVRGRQLHASEDTKRAFAILTTKQLSKSCKFPIYTRSGEETVHFEICRGFVSLQEHQLKMVRSFHQWLFSDMLRVDRPPLVFKPEIAKMQFYITVINHNSRSERKDIDWPFLCKVANSRRLEERMSRDPWFRHQHLRSTGKKLPFKFKKKKYEDGVVVAKYRSPEQPNRFYVAEVKYELNPQSSFPSQEYDSFQQYYKIKYGLDITCSAQPLLDVDHTSSRLNLLTPRYMNQKGKILPHSSLEKKRAKYENLTNRQILIPELCILHVVPASLWRKAVCLPSIIHRLTQLFVAEELRYEIACRSGIVSPDVHPSHIWPSLTFGWGSHYFAVTMDDNSDDDEFAMIENESTLKEETKSVIENQQSKDEMKNLLNKDEVIVNTSDEQNMKEEINSNKQVSNEYLESGDSVNLTKDQHTDNDENNRCTDAEGILNENLNNKTESGDGTPESTPECEIENESNNQYRSSSSDMDSNYDSDDYQDNFNLSDNDMKLKVEKDSFYQTKKKIVNRKRNKRTKQQKAEIQEDETILPADQVIALYDYSPTDDSNVGPSPALILQALTLSNASDGFNLERLEMLGDSFLKHAVTIYLYCTYPQAHEGKLSYMRSKKVSNYNLYRIGTQHNIPNKMNALIFDPSVNWLPPGYIVGQTTNYDSDDNDDSYDSDVEIGVWNGMPSKQKTQSANSKSARPKKKKRTETTDNEEEEIYDESEVHMIDAMLGSAIIGKGSNGIHGNSDRRGAMYFTDQEALRKSTLLLNPVNSEELVIDTWAPKDSAGKAVHANDPLMLDLHTQHSLADKSIADCVEAILGAYLTTCGERAAQLLLCYLGLKVLPCVPNGANAQTSECYSNLSARDELLVDDEPATMMKLNMFADELKPFEDEIGYTFRNKAYLLQAFTHASYYYNTITDCYQRLEFLGDAILDYLITSRLFDDPQQVHSPGALTDLRSALVNNTIFASLAIQHNFHKYFKSLSPELHQIMDEFVSYQMHEKEAQGMDAHLGKHFMDKGRIEDADPESNDEEYEDIEVPKALGDIFESVAGAIYMDSGMSLEAVWNVYGPMMNPLIDKFSKNVPRAPVRELLEMEPETVKFSVAEKQCDGKVRVSVEVIGKGTFKGVGRSYRIAKSAAARRALKYLKSLQHL